MDYKHEMSSNHLSQTSGDQVNLSENQDENGKTKKWRALDAAIILIVLLVGVAFYLSLTRHQSPPTVTPQTSIPTPTSVPLPSVFRTSLIELPRLYPSIQWKATESSKIVFRTRKNELMELEGDRTESTILGTYPDDFLGYYQQELIRTGWSETEFASGPNGEWHGYEKDKQYIRFGVRGVRGERLDQYQAIVENSK